MRKLEGKNIKKVLTTTKMNIVDGVRNP